MRAAFVFSPGLPCLRFARWLPTSGRCGLGVLGMVFAVFMLPRPTDAALKGGYSAREF